MSSGWRLDRHRSLADRDHHVSSIPTLGSLLTIKITPYSFCEDFNVHEDFYQKLGSGPVFYQCQQLTCLGFGIQALTTGE